MEADDAFNMVPLFYKNYLFMYQSKWMTWLTKKGKPILYSINIVEDGS